MPFANSQTNRTYQREYKRLRRSGNCQTPGQTPVPVEFRLQTARDALAILAEQIQRVQGDEETRTVEKARAIGYLVSISLRAIEIGDVASRVAILEAAMRAKT